MELRPFQMKAVEFLLRLNRAILGSEIGTGKTAIAIHYAATKAAAMNRDTRIYVVCPKSLKLNWVREIKNWTGEEAQIINSFPETKNINARWVIFTYDIFKKCCHKTKPADVLIIDEAHYLKSYKSQRTKEILIKYAVKIPHVLMLTGTPFPNKLIDAWTLLKFCAPAHVPNYWQFAYKFCYVTDKDKWGNTTRFKKIHGSKNEAELVEMCSSFVHRDEIKDVMPELPDSQAIIIDLPHNAQTKKFTKFSDQEKKEREDLVLKIFNGEQVETYNKGDLSFLSVERKDLSIAKVPETIDFVTNLLEQGEQVVLFAHHRDAIKALRAALQADYEVDMIFGDTKDTTRQALIDKFQDKKLQCLVIGIEAGGIGINLTSARIAVFHELPWTPAAYDQACGRLLRMHQQNFCTYYILESPGTLDEAVRKALFAKRRTVTKFWKEFKEQKEIEIEKSISLNI